LTNFLQILELSLLLDWVLHIFSLCGCLPVW